MNLPVLSLVVVLAALAYVAFCCHIAVPGDPDWDRSAAHRDAMDALRSVLPGRTNDASVKATREEASR